MLVLESVADQMNINIDTQLLFYCLLMTKFNTLLLGLLQGVPPNAEEPCQPCGCGGVGATGECVRDDTQFNLGIFPGACICREGFEVSS